MRVTRFGKIHSAIWADKAFRSVSPEARLFFVYLLSSDSGNSIGIFKIGLGTMQDEFREDDRSVIKEWIVELMDSGLIHYDFETNWLYFNKFLKWNTPTSPNHARSLASFVNECVKAEAPKEAIAQFLNSLKPVLGALTYSRKNAKETDLKRSYYEDFWDSVNKQQLFDYMGGENKVRQYLKGERYATEEVDSVAESEAPPKAYRSLTEALHKPCEAVEYKDKDKDKTKTRQRQRLCL